MAGPAADREIRFFADCMLGRLARWMRALGFDTKYERAIENGELLRRCREEDRVLLTRDTGIARRDKNTKLFLIESENATEQLGAVMERFGLEYREELLFSRCTHCNRKIIEVPKEEVEGRVPPYVFRTEQRFTYCPTCDKLFWRGTHRKRFLEHIISGGDS